MKILITGSTGFLGSKILRALIEKNIYVIVIKRSFSDDSRIRELNPKYKSYDIDKISLSDIFEIEQVIDVVIHCATNYGRNNESVISINYSNVVFPLELMEVAALNNTKMFINTDTSLNKNSNVKGYMQNYILTKRQFKEWGKLFADSKRIRFINMQLELIYGEGDDENKFTSYIIQSCIKNVKKIDLTNGEQKRDFVYIDDVVSSYIAVLFCDYEKMYYEEYEVGFGSAVRVKDYVDIVKYETKSNTIMNYGAIPYRENEIVFSQADISKLKSIGWEPKYDLISGVKLYLERIMKRGMI